MPSFKRRASVIDADSVDVPSKEPERSEGEMEPTQALALAEEAEAEAAEAEAVAAAARARARAARLRRQAQEAEEAEAAEKAAAEAEAAEATEKAAGTDEVDYDAALDELEPDADAEAPVKEKGSVRRHLRLPLPTWKGVAVTFMALLTLAGIAASSYMVYLHRQETATQQRTAEYVAAGRQSVVTLMSLDFNKAQEDVQRIIDNSTGEFRQDFEDQAANFAKVAEDSKVITQVEINSAAVKTMTDTTATVIVSATSRITNSQGAKEDPRSWRLSVDLAREGDQIKMSKVEFVP